MEETGKRSYFYQEVQSTKATEKHTSEDNIQGMLPN